MGEWARLSVNLALVQHSLKGNESGNQALDPSFDGGDSLGKATDIGLDLAPDLEMAETRIWCNQPLVHPSGVT